MFGLTDRRVPVVEEVGGREISDRTVGSAVGPSLRLLVVGVVEVKLWGFADALVASRHAVRRVLLSRRAAWAASILAIRRSRGGYVQSKE